MKFASKLSYDEKAVRETGPSPSDIIPRNPNKVGR